jgi:hypothetical protein
MVRDRPGLRWTLWQRQGSTEQPADLLLREDERHVPRDAHRPEGAVLDAVRHESARHRATAVEAELPDHAEPDRAALRLKARALGHPRLEDGDRKIASLPEATREEAVQVAQDSLRVGELATKCALEREVPGEVLTEAAAKRMRAAHGSTSRASRATP